MPKTNYKRVKVGNDKLILTGREVSVLQASGCQVKVLRNATKEEYNERM